MADEFQELLQVVSRAEWRKWMEENHECVSNVWLLIPLKNSGHQGPTYEEAVEVGLCFGWIDSQMGKSQGDGWKRQRFSPRKPKSNWSESNKTRAQRLITEGEMHSSGLKEIEAAKADGRWD